MRIAALDLGSNSFHLVVVDATQTPAGLDLGIVERSKEMVRLGDSTLHTGVIPTDGYERGYDALMRLRQITDRLHPQAFLGAATSALREASNGAQFVAMARQVTGADIRVLDGHEEARLIYFGARASLGLGDGRRVALFDLGGGSLEVILADGERCLFSESLKLGVLRLKDRWLGAEHHAAITDATLDRLRGAVRSTLQPVTDTLRARGFDFVAFTAGTARALRALAYPELEGTALPPQLTLASLASLEARLAAAPAALRAGMPRMDTRRLDTLLPGAVVLRTVLELLGAPEATYCEAALREGMIAAYLAGSWNG